MRPDSTASYFPVGRGLNKLLAGLKIVYEYLVLYGGLVLFGLICFSWSLIAGILRPLLPQRIGIRIGQWTIMAGFRAFLLVMKASGIVHLDLGALDSLRADRSLIIAPNHPTLVDVVLIVSRLPNIACIMKAEIWDNIFLGGGARLAGYIRNDSPRNMIRLASAATQSASQLLVFPEGTRTQPHEPVSRFKGGFALIAKTAGVPVQAVFLETNSGFLGKGCSLFRKPEFPLIYRARLGRRFEVEGEVKAFVTDLEGYYRQALGTGTAGHGEGSSEVLH